MVDHAEDVFGPVDGRNDVTGSPGELRLLEKMLRRRVRPIPYAAGLALFCLALQALTGVLMAFSYQATPDNAYASTYHIANEIPYGWLVRTVHVWGAVLVVLFLTVHIVSVFVTAAYRENREVRWFLGIFALLVCVALGVTGQLLPWDQRAYWSTSAAMTLMKQVPIVGEWVAGVMLGGDSISAATLTRFSSAHIMLLPAILIALLVLHMRAGRGSGVSATPDQSGATVPDDPEAAVPLYPDLLISWATTAVLLLCVYVVLAILVPASLGVRADASVMPEVVKPAWYLLSLYALSRYISEPVAVTIPILLVALFALLPVFDRAPSTNPRKRLAVLALGTSIVAALLILTLTGALMQ